MALKPSAPKSTAARKVAANAMPGAAESTRRYDVILYGATGFVGKQTAAYFAENAGELRWAIAGRDGAKLGALRATLGLVAARVGVIVADATDAKALTQLASQAHVVLSSAGPFALYGSRLVAACVARRTHYVDITGETPWVRKLIDRHQRQASTDGTRIIPCCGFDSIPSDLGAWMAADALMQQTGEPCVSVKACFSIRGGLNGGTFASLMNVMESGEGESFRQPFLLNPTRSVPSDESSHADPIVPHHDADFSAWLGPFFMGPINTRVVRRSAALSLVDAKSPYAHDFHYQEYLRFGRGITAAMTAAGMSAGMGIGQNAMRFGMARRLAKMFAPAPGKGPSERSMNGGGFRCELIGKNASGDLVHVTIADQGDPGNRATTKFVCEAAMALAVNQKSLPGGTSFGGVLTPASGLGSVLVKRLVAAGMKLDIRTIEKDASRPR